MMDETQNLKKDKEKLITPKANFRDKIAKISIYLLVFLAPIFFSPGP